jgi:chemotaxis protein MotB
MDGKKEDLMFPSRVMRKLLVIMTVLILSGCTIVIQKGRRSDIERISKLKSELSELEKAQAELEDRLKREIADRQVKIEMLERGLVITFVAEVLFDSGKAKLRPESFESLDKIAEVLKTTVKDLNVGIEGHTDNVPIKYSSWKSNWELSSARAMGVLHYLIDNHTVDPSRLAATGYGEYRPVASNDTKEDRQENRRVEIVILPRAEKAK